MRLHLKADVINCGKLQGTVFVKLCYLDMKLSSLVMSY